MRGTLRTLIGWGLAVVGAWCGSATAGADETAQAAATPQNGLGYFAEKVRQKQPVVAGYIGGSITVGSGASKYEHNYYWVSRMMLSNAIKARGGTLSTDNVGIGGTNSEFGAFRIGAQLLPKHLDLLVVEFCVNDGGNLKAAESMEGIVRQALRTNPQMGIVFLYTSSGRYEAEYYAKGTLPPAVELHHKVAMHYGITEVNAGPLVHQQVSEEKVTVKECFPDGTHPSDIGHKIYGEALGRTLIAALDLPRPESTPALPALLGSGKYEQARLAAVPTAELPAGWEINSKQWNWYGVPTMIGTDAKKPLVFPASGGSLTLVYQGDLELRWVTPAGERTQRLSGKRGLPHPSSFSLGLGEALATTTVTATPVANEKGEVKGEVWGYLYFAQ